MIYAFEGQVYDIVPEYANCGSYVLIKYSNPENRRLGYPISYDTYKKLVFEYGFKGAIEYLLRLTQLDWELLRIQESLIEQEPKQSPFWIRTK